MATNNGSSSKEVLLLHFHAISVMKVFVTTCSIHKMAVNGKLPLLPRKRSMDLAPG
jgi:hypothetical protein